MKSFVGFTLAAALFFAVSCKKDDIVVSNPPQEFLVKVDSVKLTKNVIWNDTLRARVWAKIGSNTCYQFARYETTRDSFRATVKVIGTYTAGSSCGAAIVELRSAIYRIYPVYPGKFTLVIQQPGGTTLTDTTTILP